MALLNYLMGILDVSHSHQRRNILGVICYKSRTPACQCTDPFPYISSEFLLLISTSIGPTRILFFLVPSEADLVLGFLLMLYQLCCWRCQKCTYSSPKSHTAAFQQPPATRPLSPARCRLNPLLGAGRLWCHHPQEYAIMCKQKIKVRLHKRILIQMLLRKGEHTPTDDFYLSRNKPLF